MHLWSVVLFRFSHYCVKLILITLNFSFKIFYLKHELFYYSLFSQRWKKTYECASNACVNFFLARVKYVANFTVLFAKVRNIAILHFYCHFFHFMTINGALEFFLALLWHFMAIVSTFTLLHYFVENSLLSQFTHSFWVTLFWHKP